MTRLQPCLWAPFSYVVPLPCAQAPGTVLAGWDVKETSATSAMRKWGFVSGRRERSL